MNDNLDIAIALFKAMMSKDYDTVRALFDPAVTFQTAFGAGTGPEGLIELSETFHRAMPDLEHKMVDCVAADETVAWELEFSGTHTGPLATPGGTIPPTGRRLHFSSCDYIKLAGGRVVSFHLYMDSGALLAQLSGA